MVYVVIPQPYILEGNYIGGQPYDVPRYYICRALLWCGKKYIVYDMTLYDSCMVIWTGGARTRARFGTPRAVLHSSRRL